MPSPPPTRRHFVSVSVTVRKALLLSPPPSSLPPTSSNQEADLPNSRKSRGSGSQKRHTSPTRRVPPAPSRVIAFALCREPLALIPAPLSTDLCRLPAGRSKSLLITSPKSKGRNRKRRRKRRFSRAPDASLRRGARRRGRRLRRSIKLAGRMPRRFPINKRSR